MSQGHGAGQRTGLPASALVFDFGLKHIGVAVALSEQNLARGIATVAARDGKPHWPALDALLDEWRPDCLVVGDPLNMDGTASSMAAHARNFARQIAERYGLDLDLVDERLSTFEALSRGADERDSHALAAETIAETWLGRARPLA
ncbi:MAG: Holliday junction resolvase RuvX [Gammaproteobacteria bacterium]|nr:Holliday junction resolvase RuvX [Gammaproteobacteria bacterium]